VNGDPPVRQEMTRVRRLGAADGGHVTRAGAGDGNGRSRRRFPAARQPQRVRWSPTTAFQHA
jgi:hypothetical protein